MQSPRCEGTSPPHTITKHSSNKGPCPISATSHPHPLPSPITLPCERLTQAVDTSIYCPKSPQCTNNQQGVARSCEGHDASHLGRGHMHVIWHGSAHVAQFVWQEKHPQRSQGTSIPTPTINVCCTPSGHLLGKDNIGLPKWGASVAHTAWAPLDPQEKQNVDHAPCSKQAHTSILKEEEMLPVHPRLHPGIMGPPQP